ncbi:unnamed protein product [Mesocestoides corti]|uniref:Coiled-coil domain-containing protein 61 n=3 Tax=Mesocestoides corti TaxID=53468 RepID=A0A0R3U3B5_MESCO|nr:unnamed protein product [Mesocestoides corti]
MNDLKPAAFFSIVLCFSSRDYCVSFVNDRNKSLKVEVRDLKSDEEWHGCFSSDYIEELTRKTGNYKSYGIFVTMLYAVSFNKSKSLILDLVDYEDLENFRKSNMINEKPLVLQPDRQRRPQRRYLILTYISDFDKTFYPLPLTYVGVVDRAKLIKQISKLRDALYNERFEGGIRGEKDTVCSVNRLKMEYENNASKLRSRSASTDSSSYLGGISKKSQRAVSPSRSRNRYSRDSVRSLPVSGPRSHKDSNKFVTPPSPKRRSRARSANSVGSIHSAIYSSVHLFATENRFDPTAFVQKQRQKRQEAKQKKKPDEVSRLRRKSSSPSLVVISKCIEPCRDETRRVRDTSNDFVRDLRSHRLSPLSNRFLDAPDFLLSDVEDRYRASSYGVRQRTPPHGIDDFNLSECDSQSSCSSLRQPNDYRWSKSRGKQIREDNCCSDQMNRSKSSSSCRDSVLDCELGEMHRRLDKLQGFFKSYFT